MIEAGKDPPETYFTQPLISECNSFYWEAFNELSTERQIGMGIGPIPRSAIMAYAYECDLYGDAAEQFARIIRDVDSEFLRSSNSVKTGKDKDVEEASVTDADGVKRVMSRLMNRASTAGKAKTKPHGKS